MKYPVIVRLTKLQAECLAQLAQEADFDTFTGETGGSRQRECAAGEAAIDRLTSALRQACSPNPAAETAPADY